MTLTDCPFFVGDDRLVLGASATALQIRAKPGQADLPIHLPAGFTSRNSRYAKLYKSGLTDPYLAEKVAVLADYSLFARATYRVPLRPVFLDLRAGGADEERDGDAEVA